MGGAQVYEGRRLGVAPWIRVDQAGLEVVDVLQVARPPGHEQVHTQEHDLHEQAGSVGLYESVTTKAAAISHM